MENNIFSFSEFKFEYKFMIVRKIKIKHNLNYLLNANEKFLEKF
jgi:hypothetical protein